MVFGVHNVFEWTSSTAKMELKAAKEGEKISSKSLNDDKNKHIFLIPSSIQFYLSHTHSLTRKHFTRLISFCGAFLLFSSQQKNIRVRTHAHRTPSENSQRPKETRIRRNSNRNKTKKKKSENILCDIRPHATQWASSASGPVCLCSTVFHVQQKYTLLSRENIILFIKDK